MRRGNASAHAERMRVVSLPPEAVRAPTATATRRSDRPTRQTDRQRVAAARMGVPLASPRVADGLTRLTVSTHSGPPPRCAAKQCTAWAIYSQSVSGCFGVHFKPFERCGSCCRRAARAASRSSSSSRRRCANVHHASLQRTTYDLQHTTCDVQLGNIRRATCAAAWAGVRLVCAESPPAARARRADARGRPGGLCVRADAPVARHALAGIRCIAVHRL